MVRITFKVLLGLSVIAWLFVFGTLASSRSPLAATAVNTQQIHQQSARYAFVAPEQIVEPFSGLTQSLGARYALPGFAQMLSDPAEEKLKSQRAASQRELMRTFIDTTDPRLQGWVNLLAATD